MTDIFLLKLLLSFIIGGLWTIMATVLADKFGTKIGGFIAGLPSTMLIGLFFIAWTQNTQTAVSATTIVPLAEGAKYFFLASYAYFLNRGIFISLTYSFLIWFFLIFISILIKINSYPVSLFIYFLCLICAYLFLEYKLKVKSVSGRVIKYTSSIILFRGFLTGIIVSLAVVMAKIGGPILGGIFSDFPAIFTSTLVITYFSHGEAFSRSITKSLMLGSITILVYSMAVRYLYSPFGLIWGTLTSIIISLISGYFIYRFVVKRFS